MRFAEIVKDIKSAEEHIRINKIVPDEIIVVWHEDVEVEVDKEPTLKDKKNEAPSEEHRSKTKEHERTQEIHEKRALGLIE